MVLPIAEEPLQHDGVEQGRLTVFLAQPLPPDALWIELRILLSRSLREGPAWGDSSHCVQPERLCESVRVRHHGATHGEVAAAEDGQPCCVVHRVRARDLAAPGECFWLSVLMSRGTGFASEAKEYLARALKAAPASSSSAPSPSLRRGPCLGCAAEWIQQHDRARCLCGRSFSRWQERLRRRCQGSRSVSCPP